MDRSGFSIALADGRPFAVDTRAPKMLGKLIIDLGVDSGGIYRETVTRTPGPMPPPKVTDTTPGAPQN